jgi:hypothetical protein
MPITSSEGELPSPAAGWFDLTMAITNDGRLARLQASVDVRSALRERREGAMAGTLASGVAGSPLFPSGTLAKIVLFDGATELAVCTFALEATWPLFDRLPNGQWIVVDARCRAGELNARLLAEGGSMLRRFCLGDGIEHLQCDEAGAVWVAYFDEGVFGNYGWDGPDGPQPIGAPGLVMFNTEGEIGWAHDARAEGATGFDIDDCGALNVHGGEVWCSFYGDHANGSTYPIMRLTARGETGWRTPLFLVDAIAIEDGTVAAISHKLNEPYQISLVELGDTTGVITNEIDLASYGLGPEPPQGIFGRGATLHVIQGSRWFALAVADIRAGGRSV